MNNYFTNCQTLEEVKSLYRSLAKELHPDKGGSTEAMQVLNAQYTYGSQAIKTAYSHSIAC